MPTFKVRGLICDCGAYLTAATNPMGCSPMPGDFSVCVICLKPYRFDDSLNHVPVTRESFAKLPEDTQEDLVRKVVSMAPEQASEALVRMIFEIGLDEPIQKILRRLAN